MSFNCIGLLNPQRKANFGLLHRIGNTALFQKKKVNKLQTQESHLENRKNPMKLIEMN